MKLQRLTIENFKGIRRLVITPIGNHTELCGKNQAGKSSALDGFEGLIRGARGMQDAPLREGATKGLLEADLGDIVITRRLTKKNQRPGALDVIAKDGSKWKQPRLDMIFGDFTFDPTAFVAMSPADQIGVLQRLAGPEFCERLAELEAAELQAVEDRKEAKQHLKAWGEPERPDFARVDAVDSSALMHELTEAREFNQQQAHKAEQIRRHDTAISEALSAVESLKEQIAELQKKLVDREKHAAELFAMDLEQPEPKIDTAALEESISNASAINSQANAWEQHDERLEHLSELTREVGKHEAAVATARDKKRRHAKSAKLPIDGVEWNDKGVYVDGRPFAMQSTSQQLRMGMLLGLPALGDLRIMLIRKGSDLDNDTFKTVCELADEFDCHLLIEKVGEAHEGANAITIVDGEEGESK